VGKKTTHVLPELKFRMIVKFSDQNKSRLLNFEKLYVNRLS